MPRLLPIALLLSVASAGLVHADEPQDQPELPFEAEALENMDEDAAEAIIGSVNPLDNDLRGLELAIRLHNGFRIEPDGAIFELGVTDGAGETRIDEDFVLIETSGVSSPTLIEAQREEFYISSFKLSERDFQRMAASDTILQELKATSPGENTLTFNATVITCAAPDTITPDEYRFAMFVRTAPDVDFVSLSGGDVIVSKEYAGPFLHAWDPCDEDGES